MATRNRLKGKEGFYLSLKVVDSVDPAFVAAGDDCKAWEITSEDRDDSDLTFWEAEQGQIKDFTLALTSIISFDQGSLWRWLWEHPGADVEVVLGPKGNAVAALGKPVFEFVANTGAKPTLQNEARTSNEGAEFEHELKADGDLDATFVDA